MERKKTARKKKKRFSISEEYRKCWDYIKESRNFIYFIIGIFIFFCLMGFFIPTPKILYDYIASFLKELVKETENLSQLNLIGYIIFNNIRSTFFSIILGAFLGIFPLIDTVANGYLLGFVSSVSVSANGISSLLRIFPHGIFELPAIFISLGLGLKTGMFIFQKDKIKAGLNYLGNSLRVFLLVVIPLLIIAGIIEGTFIFLFK